MNMWMRPQLLTPGVQYAEKSDLAAQPFGILAESEEGFCRLGKQQLVYESPVMGQDGAEQVRKGKYTVVVGNRQQVAETLFDPLPAGYPLAFGTVPVPAGVVFAFDVIAGVAAVRMKPVVGSSAVLDGMHDRVLSFCQFVISPIVITCFAKDIGHFISLVPAGYS